MRLSEALTILRESPTAAGAPEFRVSLVCGFTPLHLRTFLAARLQLAFPPCRIQIETGLYGDFLGNLDRLKKESADCVVIVIEWSDLDARLGLRSLGGWRQTDFTDILENAGSRIARIQDAVENVSSRVPVTISLPTLALPPFQPTVPAWRASLFDLQLQQLLASFAVWIASRTTAKIASSAWLDQISPPAGRLDVKSELLDGFPYTLPHAAALSQALTHLIETPQPKKGLITDLDNTLWKGIVGEAGPDGISWELDRQSHMHAVYQELLLSFSGAGVLIAAASKNDPALVEEAFRRPDIILPKDRIFPLEIHWNQKSRSVARILKAWNIGADSVVFVDDSPAELAEVKAAHPAIECIPFPKAAQDVYPLLARLRNLFAKSTITEEDRIRLDSIRSSSGILEQTNASAASADAFLEQAGSILRFSFDKTSADPRVLELINKTNQFNLNGNRYSETSLREHLSSPDSFLLKAAYTDKFGPLGKIAILLGRVNGETLYIDSWVMSCRAFSRRIEHACLDQLFRKYAVHEVEFDFLATERNGPVRDFLAGFLDAAPQSRVRISRELFQARCARLFHRVEEEVYG